MNVIKTEIPDVLIFEPKVFGDERGFFFESFNQRIFEEAVGRKVEFVQDNHSKSSKGVLRGLHYQLEPYAQGKLVRCVVGEVLRIMLIGYIFNCYSQISFANIQAFGKAKYTAYIHMMEFIPYLIMLYIISKEYGVIGVAWLWTIRVIIDFLMLLYMSYRCNNLMKKG